MNKIYADVNEDDNVDEPNFQWVVLASEAEEHEAALREELYQAKEARDAEMLNGVRTQQRLTVAEQRAGVLKALLPNAELALKALNVAVSVYDVELADNARRGLRELIAALKPAAEGEGS